MESTDNTALNDQLKELHEKISNFAYSIEQTNISLDKMQKEIKSLKNPNESYASVVGANNAGKVVYKPQTFNKKLSELELGELMSQNPRRLLTECNRTSAM